MRCFPAILSFLARILNDSTSPDLMAHWSGLIFSANDFRISKLWKRSTLARHFSRYLCWRFLTAAKISRLSAVDETMGDSSSQGRSKKGSWNRTLILYSASNAWHAQYLKLDTLIWWQIEDNAITILIVLNLVQWFLIMFDDLNNVLDTINTASAGSELTLFVLSHDGQGRSKM